MYKKVIASVLALTLVAGAVAAPAVDVVSLGSGITASAAATTFTVNHLKYTVTSEDSVALSGVETDSGLTQVMIEDHIANPSDGKTYYITSVAAGAFENEPNIQTVDLSNALKLKKIGASAFKGCKNVTTIKFPSVLETIGESAFQGCFSGGALGNNREVTPIDVPSSVITLGNYAFADCQTLQTATVDAMKVGTNVFKGCLYLQTITFGSSVREIGASVLENCERLTSVTIGTNSLLQDLPANFCANCKRLASITIPDNIKNIGLGAFSDCTMLATVKLPAALNVVGASAFYNTDLTGITVPNTVTTVGTKAFGYVETFGKKPNFTIYSDASVGSPVQVYASSNGFSYQKPSTGTANDGTTTTDPNPQNPNGAGTDVNPGENGTTPGTTKAKDISKLNITAIKKLKMNKDYKVTSASSTKGTVVLQGIGNYAGTRTVKIGKATVKAAVGKKYIKVSRAKSVAGATGYQFYRTGKTVSTRSTSTTFKGLKSKKKYRVKVRAYIKLGSKVYYGPWSASKVVTVK